MIGECMNFEERMKSGEMYFENEFPKELNKKNLKCIEKIYKFNKCNPRKYKKANAILKNIFAEMGEDCYILAPFHASWGCNIHLGNNVYINYNAVFIDDADIYIGNNVMIAPNVSIVTANHPLDPNLREKLAEFNKSIHIDDNVWIATRCTIFPGVHIGENSAIGAGSIVTKDIPANVLAYGSKNK